MKKLPFAVFLALVGSGFYTQSAHAALAANAGDIFIGFNNFADTSNDYLVDVGSASLYTTPGVPFEVASQYIGTASQNNTNLTTVFATDSAGWYSSGNTYWGIIGGPLSTDNSSLIYVGVPRDSGDSVPSSAPPQDNTQNQAGDLTYVTALVNYYKSSGNSLNGTQGTSQSTSNSASFYSESQGAAFGNYNDFYNYIAGDGMNGDVIDLWKTPPTGSGSPVYEGNFDIASNGAIVYTPATVPEPSAWAALAGGVGLLGLVRRRRAVTA